jgi:hypothetical protein
MLSPIAWLHQKLIAAIFFSLPLDRKISKKPSKGKNWLVKIKPFMRDSE